LLDSTSVESDNDSLSIQLVLSIEAFIDHC